MPRYIDADAFRHRILCQRHNMSVNEVLELISTMPTADVRENVHAHWVIEREQMPNGEIAVGQFCSNCDYPQYLTTRFCPNCSAEMLKGEDNE